MKISELKIGDIIKFSEVSSRGESEIVEKTENGFILKRYDRFIFVHKNSVISKIEETIIDR